ncbi:SAP domain-containing protein [Deltaproteobacteria bacterium TL4]
MLINKVREIATKRGLSVVPKTKKGMIQAMQTQEGNKACFATNNSDICEQNQCLWREDCLQADKNEPKKPGKSK